MTFQEQTWLNPEKCPFSELYGHLKSWLANVFPSLPWNPPAGSALRCLRLAALALQVAKGSVSQGCEEKSFGLTSVKGVTAPRANAGVLRGHRHPVTVPRPVLSATPYAELSRCDYDQAGHLEPWGQEPGCPGEGRGWTRDCRERAMDTSTYWGLNTCGMRYKVWSTQYRSLCLEVTFPRGFSSLLAKCMLVEFIHWNTDTIESRKTQGP